MASAFCTSLAGLFVVVSMVGCAADATDQESEPAASSSEALASSDYSRFCDDHSVDRTLLDPPLFLGDDPTHPTWTWKCAQTSAGPVCYGQGNNTEIGDDDACGESPLTHHYYSEDGVSRRDYSKKAADGHYKLFNRTINYSNIHETWNIIGKPVKVKGSGAYTLTDNNFKVKGDLSTATETHEGTEILYYKVSNNQEIVEQKGKIIFPPNADPIIVSGTWDWVTDPDAALARLCAASN